MASIKKKDNGSYLITVSLGRDSSDKQIFRRTTYYPEAKSEKKIAKEVEDFARDFERRVKNGEYFSGEKMSFREFAQRWDENWASNPENLTPSIREGYIEILEKRAYPHIGFMKISDIRPLHINAIYEEMKDEGKASGTIKRAHCVINSVFKYAYRMEVIKDNPCSRIELPKSKQNTDLHYFTLEESKRFLGALTKEYTHKYKGSSRVLSSTGETYTVGDYEAKHTIPTQYQSYFSLAIYGGFRRGELIALTWEDIDFENHTVSITKSVAKTKSGQIVKSTKTVSGERVIKLPRQCFDTLAIWKKEQKELSLTLGTYWKGYRGKDFDRNPIFITDEGERMNLDTPYHKFKDIISMYNAQCENDNDRLPNIRLHDLRHTSATLLLSENVDIETVSHRLGHSKASITLDVYGHWMKETDEKASNTLENLFASNQ